MCEMSDKRTKTKQCRKTVTPYTTYLDDRTTKDTTSEQLECNFLAYGGGLGAVIFVVLFPLSIFCVFGCFIGIIFLGIGSLARGLNPNNIRQELIQVGRSKNFVQDRNDITSKDIRFSMTAITVALVALRCGAICKLELLLPSRHDLVDISTKCQPARFFTPPNICLPYELRVVDLLPLVWANNNTLVACPSLVDNEEHSWYFLELVTTVNVKARFDMTHFATFAFEPTSYSRVGRSSIPCFVVGSL